MNSVSYRVLKTTEKNELIGIAILLPYNKIDFFCNFCSSGSIYIGAMHTVHTMHTHCTYYTEYIVR